MSKSVIYNLYMFWTIFYSPGTVLPRLLLVRNLALGLTVLAVYAPCMTPNVPSD